MRIKFQYKFTIFLLLFSFSNSGAGTVQLQSIGDISTWPETSFRWMDIADFLYSTDYQANFNYDQPSVTLTFCTAANIFAGTLKVTGLKPNFAYQIKLVGKPENIWGEDGDDSANERIGYAGRWWRLQPNPGNSNDAEYEEYKDDPNYVYEGYLFFDFFVTDQYGNAMLSFLTNSSFHVLWATPDSTGYGTGHRTHGLNDSPVRYYGFTASPTSNIYAYNTDFGDAHVGIFAEWEPDRAPPGELKLPVGSYNCRFILTEESFHQNGLGGGWASVLGNDDIFFTIVPYSEADIDRDGDVDGIDLAQNIETSESNIAEFATDFGRTNCQANY
jgi:hypothetical protein